MFTSVTRNNNFFRIRLNKLRHGRVKVKSIMMINSTLLKVRVRLMLFLVSVPTIIGCAGMDPLTMIASPERDRQHTICLMQANYQLQKKYDLLEKSLLTEHERHSNNEHTLGQLYAALDLAGLYTYGLINYEKALDYYDRADEQNKICREREIASDGEGIVYYKGGGGYALPRKYNFSEICDKIRVGRKHIAGLLGEYYGGVSKVQAADRKTLYPEIRTVFTNQYAHATQVSGTLLDPAMFDSFEQQLLRKTKDYFQLRHKLSEREKIYYIHYNVARCLIKSSNFPALSFSHVNGILRHINKASACNPTSEVTLQEAYLNFGRVLCFNRMGKHAEAIRCFAGFQRDVRQVQTAAAEYMDYLKDTRRKAISRGVGKTAAFLVLDILTMGQAMASGGGFHSQLTAAGVLDLGVNIPDMQRQISFLGESEYSKEINLILNMDEQLQLFRAAGASYHRMGNISESIIYNKEAINIINNLRSTISSESGRIGFAAFKEDIYNKLIDDLIASNSPREAFSYSENARARALVDLLGSKKGIAFKNNEANNYVRNIRKSQIHRDGMLEDICISDEQARHINTLQNPLSIGRGIVVKQLSHHENKFNIADQQELLSLITVANLKISQIQAFIPEDCTLVEYYVSDNNVYAWVLDKVMFRFHALDITPEKLKEKLRYFNKLIQSPENKSSLNQIKLAGQVLYNMLYSGLEQHIKTKQIFIVGHRFLHFLPFEAMYDGQRFLVERYPFSYLPSSSLLQFLKPANRALDSFLALGNPEIDYVQDIGSLEGAERETVSIAKMFPGGKVYLGRNATETVFRKEARNYQVLHIACHGLFDSTDPLNSRVLLSRDNEHDGKLTAREIYGIQLNASLVTLSACESGVSGVENGDELVGFVRAFIFSGTSSLLASLWKVDDIATHDIMSRFYRHLVSGSKETARAIQLAKIDLIKSTQYNHPFFWAPFRLYGLGF